MHQQHDCQQPPRSRETQLHALPKDDLRLTVCIFPWRNLSQSRKERRRPWCQELKHLVLLVYYLFLEES